MNGKTLGDRIKFHRKQLGLTQEQLAEQLGVSPQAVSKWENNLSCPDISILPELAAIFGISVDALLGKRGAEEETIHTAEVVEAPEEKDFSLHWKIGGGGWLFAIFLITYAGLLLAAELVPAMAVSWWTLLWTTGLAYLGIGGLLMDKSGTGVVATLAGIFFLLEAYGVISLHLSWGIVVPVILLLWGLSLLFDGFFGKRRCKKKYKASHREGRKLHHEYSCDNGYLHCDLSFGEHRTAVVTPILRGGSIDSNFGDFTVDFSACDSLAEDCVLEVSNRFGELTLLVPDKYCVVIEVKNNFAAAPEIKGSPAETVEGTLCLRADLSFGALVICYI